MLLRPAPYPNILIFRNTLNQIWKFFWGIQSPHFYYGHNFLQTFDWVQQENLQVPGGKFFLHPCFPPAPLYFSNTHITLLKINLDNECLFKYP